MRFPNFDRIITLVLQIILVGMVPLFILDGAYARAGAALLAVLISLMPALVKHNYKVTMPWLFEFFITILLLLHLLGLRFDFYGTFWWWDWIAHIFGSALIGALGFYLVYALQESGKIRVSLRMMAVFAFIVTLAIGGMWEITEYITDQTIGSNNQPSNADTMVDLINDMFAGIVVAFAGMLYIKKEPEEKLRKQLGKRLPHRQGKKWKFKNDAHAAGKDE